MLTHAARVIWLVIGILALAFRPSSLAWAAVILGVANTSATLIGLPWSTRITTGVCATSWLQRSPS